MTDKSDPPLAYYRALYVSRLKASYDALLKCGEDPGYALLALNLWVLIGRPTKLFGRPVVPKIGYNMVGFWLPYSSLQDSGLGGKVN